MNRLVLAALLVLLPLPATAQARLTCEAAEFHAFDFWIGEWTVVDTAGTVLGTNTITSVADGCGLLEQWQGAQGGTGTSLNHYDPRTQRWHQAWVGAGQSILHLEGGLEDGSMVLGGERPGRSGTTVLDRIRWTPHADGTLRQHWQVSNDGGATWTDAFDGLYRKARRGG